MKAIDWKAICRRSGWVTLIAVGVCLTWFGYAAAGPVVNSQPQTSQAIEQQEPTGLPAYPWLMEEGTPGAGTRSEIPVPRATTPLPSGAGGGSAQPQQTPQQPAQQYPPVAQPMPVPPTYAPGTPAAQQGGAMMDPYGQLPMPPTAYGPYDSPGGGAPTGPGGMMGGPGMGGPDTGYGMGGGGGMMRPSMPQSGGGGYGMMPQTPTASIGQAALMDPSFGRYDAQSISEATAPRQPATIGQAQSQILRGAKPFSAYRPASAYSPYMRLNRDMQYGSVGGTNTYYEYVKPLLEQQRENQQVDRNIQGLTDTARTGYQALQSLKQRPGASMQNAAPRVPATFMNTGRYYPGRGGR